MIDFEHSAKVASLTSLAVDCSGHSKAALEACLCCPQKLCIYTWWCHLGLLSQSVFQPSFERMHFPTLPKRWRLSSSESAKPPKHGRQASASPRKTPPFKLNRSASFSSDPVFKVPPCPSQQPQREPQPPKRTLSFSRPVFGGSSSNLQQPSPKGPCPNCCQSSNVLAPNSELRIQKRHTKKNLPYPCHQS